MCLESRDIAAAIEGGEKDFFLFSGKTKKA